VQDSDSLTTSSPGINKVGLFQRRIRINVDKRVDGRVFFRDLIQTELSQLAAGNFTGTQQIQQLRDRQTDGIKGTHGIKSRRHFTGQGNVFANLTDPDP
jgi:hypothetical protein